jgi:hypothetical protein
MNLKTLVYGNEIIVAQKISIKINYCLLPRSIITFTIALLFFQDIPAQVVKLIPNPFRVAIPGVSRYLQIVNYTWELRIRYFSHYPRCIQ